MHLAQERRRIGAVDRAMIEGLREHADRPDRDAVALGPSITTGFLCTPSVDRIATCGWLMIGAVISVPNTPEFDSV